MCLWSFCFFISICWLIYVNMLPWISTFEWWMYLFVCLKPECVARVPVSLWGSGGWGCVRQTTVRNRSQPFAWCPYGLAVPMASSANLVNFGGFKSRVASFRVAGVAGVALRDSPVTVQTVSYNVLKVVLCGRRSTFASFQADELHVSWQAQHFGDLHRHFAWQVQRFRRVALFFFRIALSGLRGDNVQILWQAWHFLMWSRTYIKVHEKTRTKTPIENWESLARNARSEPPTCLVSILWFSCGIAVSMW